MRFRALLAVALSCVSLTGSGQNPVAVNLMLLWNGCGTRGQCAVDLYQHRQSCGSIVELVRAGRRTRR